MSVAVQMCAVSLLLGALYWFGWLTFPLLLPLIWRAFRRPTATRVEGKGRAVLITGCDTGFGQLLARQLDGLGFRVFAGCLFPDGEGAQSLKRECSPELKVLKLDVTLDGDVAKAKEFVEGNLPAEGLLGLVNNAGISTWGNLDWNNIQVYQRCIDVNLFGSIRMAQTFIPLLRQSKGCLIFMSSMSAYIHSQGASAYVITKCGVQALSDCLRHEMKKFEVKVSVIEPGNYASATNILKLQTFDKIWNGLNDAAKQAYSKEYIQRCIDYVENAIKGRPRNAMEVTNTIIEALVSPNPKARYLVVSMAERIVIFMCVHFPVWFTDAFFYYVGVHKSTKPWWLLN